MKKLILFLLLGLPLLGQTVHTFPALDTDNAFTGPNLFNLLQMKNHTVSELSALTPKRNGLTELITDGTSTTDCVTGSGAFYVLCYYKTGDSTWHPYFSGLGALVSAEWLPPLFTTNCASPTNCSDIVFTKEAVSPYTVYAGPSNPTLGLPYPTNFTECHDTTGSLSSAVCTYNSPVQAGHHLVACYAVDSLGGETLVGFPADALTNVWGHAGGSLSPCFIAPNTGNGADAVTFTFTGAVAYAVTMYEEVGADSIDTTLGNGVGTTTQTWTVTTAQADGYTLTNISSGPGGLSYQQMASTATYNQELQASEYGGSGLGPSFIGSIGWGQMASAGSHTITTTCTAGTAGGAGTCDNVGVLIAFKPSGPSIPVLPNFLFLTYNHLVAGGYFPPIAVGNAGQALVVDPTGHAITLASVGTGTVTTFSAGTLSPLFTTSVANPTTAPALTFTLSSAAKYQFFGRNAGTTGAPAYFNLPLSAKLLTTDADGQIVEAAAASSPIVVSATGGISCPTCGTGTGSVSSAAMTGDGTVYNASVTGSPITTTGTFSPSLHTQTANTVLAGPTSGGVVAPTFRSLVAADLPTSTFTVGITDIAPVSGDAILILDSPVAVTITRVECGTSASTSAIVDIKPAAESAWGTLGSSILSGTVTAVPGGAAGTISTSALSAHVPLMLSVGTVTGTVGQLYCAVEYTRAF